MGLPTAEYLRHAFVYNPETGVLKWNSDRPLSHFKNESSRKSWIGRFAGKVAGCQSRDYVLVYIAGKLYGAHRIIWTILTGSDPGRIGIDHVNGYGRDNKPNNLRLATKSENGRNSKMRSNNSGHRGVCWVADRKRWMAHIGHNGRLINLGHFDQKEDAIQARAAAETLYHGQFAASVSREQQRMKL